MPHSGCFCAHINAWEGWKMRIFQFGRKWTFKSLRNELYVSRLRSGEPTVKIWIAVNIPTRFDDSDWRLTRENTPPSYKTDYIVFTIILIGHVRNMCSDILINSHPNVTYGKPQFGEWSRWVRIETVWQWLSWMTSSPFYRAAMSDNFSKYFSDVNPDE